MLNEVQKKTKRHHMMFLYTTFFHFADFLLRVACLWIYWIRGHYRGVAVLGVVQVFGILVSTYITFHDADVLLWMQAATQRSRILRWMTEIIMCLLCSCCQGIHVKRALARQIQAAEVSAEFDTEKRDAQTQSAQFAGPERTLPATLLMGVVFLLYNSQQQLFGYLLGVSAPDPRQTVILWASCGVSLFTVSLGVIEIDVAVSSYVSDRYHWDLSVRGTRAGRTQWLFPVVHLIFRAAEISARVILFTCLFFVCNESQEIAWVVVVLDYALGVTILRVNSPDDERVAAHSLLGFILLASDLSYFVDQPNFALPARRISWQLQMCRCALLVVVFTRMMMTVVYQDTLTPIYMVNISAFLFAVRYLPWNQKIGHDLHTAADRGDVGRLKKLLHPQANGQILDVNATTKDGVDMTPLMLAAKQGHLLAVKILLEMGATHESKDVAANTALHHAALHGHTEVCRALLYNGADWFGRNDNKQTPADLVVQRRARPATELCKLFQRRQQQRFQHPSRGNSSANVVTMPAGVVSPSHIRGLFPHAAADDWVSPRALRSVSSLLIARSAGLLARRILTRTGERNEARSEEIQIGLLRRVRELGQGGFGKVIEVQLPSEAFGTVNVHRRWSQDRRQPRGYALKLQPKLHSNRQAHCEVLALRRAQHPFIVRLERAFQTTEHFALLLELCPTDLNRELCKLDAQGLSLGLQEARAARYLAQILLALTYLHNKEDVFRDVKPENILISADDDAKLTDFGLATEVSSGGAIAFTGTVGFLAPELSRLNTEDASSIRSGGRKPRKGDPYKCDAYSFGVTLQMTLLGTDGARRKEVRKKGPTMLPLLIDEEENTYMCSQLLESGRLSVAAHDLLVRRLLPFDPNMRSRLVAPEVMQHAFFLETLGCNDIATHLLPAQCQES